MNLKVFYFFILFVVNIKLVNFGSNLLTKFLFKKKKSLLFYKHCIVAVPPAPPKTATDKPALDFDDAKRVGKALRILLVKLDEFSKYPGQWEWFKNFVWFHQHKFPFFKQILEIDDMYYELVIYCKDNKSTMLDVVCQNIFTSLARIQDIAEFFYNLYDIIDMEQWAVDSFNGLRPEHQLEIYKTLFDLMLKISSGDNVQTLNDLLKFIRDHSERVYTSVKQVFTKKDRNKLLLSKIILSICDDFEHILGWMNEMKEPAKPFRETTNRIKSLMLNVTILTTKPEMLAPADPMTVVDQFRRDFSNIATRPVISAFKSVWINNNNMSIDMIEIAKVEKFAIQELKDNIKLQTEKNYQVINLCFRGIMVIVCQIGARIEKQNDKIYRDIKASINHLSRLTEQKIIDEIYKYDYYANFYVSKRCNCIKLIKNILRITDRMAKTIQFILKSKDEKKMDYFEKDFRAVMYDMKDVQTVVMTRTEPLYH